MNTHSARGGSAKRERILDSAMRVFANKGFFGAKVADIAAEAGVADGTIYLYFKSKDDLLISLFETQMEKVITELKRATASGDTAPDKLRRLVRAYLGLVEANRHATEVITIELRQSAKFMKEYANPRFAELLKLIAAIIDEGQRAGTVRADVPPPIAARALFGALDELALMWVTAERKKERTIDARKLAEWANALIVDGLQITSERRAT